MSETKHTPGPWQLSRYTNYEGWSVWAEGHGCIAERWYPEASVSELQNEQMKANALLIATAPELLDFARSLSKRTYCICKFGQAGPTHEECTKCAASALVAKAEGRNA